ncbi:hypothetical protein BDW66DRAFT_152165 [Aspergillus desertorum]
MDAEIKQERETSTESNTPLSTVRRLMNNTQPECNRTSAHTIIAESKFTTGPVELHAELKAILETWHEKEGKAVPPCKYYYYNPKCRNGMRPWKAFDREGREVDLTHFLIRAPAYYSVLAARFADNSLKLVCSHSRGKYGSFLQAWLGWDGGFEPKPCIIRRWGDSGGVIDYQPEAWTSLEEQRQEEHQGAQPEAQHATQPSPWSVTRKRAAPSAPTSMPHNKRRQQDVRDKTSSDSEESDSSTGSTGDDESSETSEGSDEDDESDTNTRVSRTGPQQNSSNDRPPPVSVNNRSRPSMADNRPLPVSGRDPELLFKLSFFKFTVQHVRDFPLEECKTSKALFEKASAFYRIFDRNVKVEVLSCQLATTSEQHYIFAGSEGEYGLLVRQAQEVARSTGKPLTIEIGLVQS